MTTDKYINKMFHTFNDDGEIQYQGLVREKLEDGVYRALLFNFIDGSPGDEIEIYEDDFDSYKFYSRQKDWHAAYDEDAARFWHKYR